MSHGLSPAALRCLQALVADGDGALWVDVTDVDRTATSTQAWEILEAGPAVCGCSLYGANQQPPEAEVGVPGWTGGARTAVVGDG